MDCNKEEAVRAKDIAEKKMESRDFTGARKFALKAQQLYPNLENIAQMLTVCDVHCSAEQKLFGNEMDWYGILQLELTANDATIKKQYRKFALQLHPDKNKFAGAEAAFKLIGETQRVLLDREKRSEHDMRRRGSMNKNAKSCHNKQKVHMNFNSVVQTNVRPNFTKFNPQQKQQQQSRMPVQPGLNGGRPTFWTVCSFCSVKYQYYREVLNKPLRCQQCNRPFIAYDVGMQATSPATNSSQQAFGQQKDGLNHGAFKVGVRSQGNLHAEKSNTGPYEKKGPTDVSGKPNGKRRKRVMESRESSDSIGSTDSEDEMVAGEDGFPGVQNHSTYREEHPRRSTRQKHQVSYKENVSDGGDDFLRPSKRGKGSGSPCGAGESHGEAVKMNDQNGLAADLKEDHKEAKQKQHFYSKECLFNRNEEAKEVRRKEAVGGLKQMDEVSEHPTPDSTSNATNHPTVYVYPDAEFGDFDKGKKKDCFAAGQIWAIYDTTDGMPRFYALIRKVLSPGFKLRITWFEPHPDDNDEINWVNKELPVACGKYKLGNTDITEDHLVFSHLVLCEKIGHNIFEVYPRKGETWALFKNWDIKWYMDVESHRKYEFEFVEILSDYVEGEGVFVAYLAKLKGFVSLFSRIMKEGNHSFQISPMQLFRFSHRVPSFKMTGKERVGVHIGSYELDPASLPMNIEKIAVPEDLEVKVGHSPSGGMSTRSSDGLKSTMACDGHVSTFPTNMETSNLAKENKGSIDDVSMNLEEIAVREDLDVKVGHSSSGGENTRSSHRSKPVTTSEGDVSTSKVNLERRDLAEENKDSVDDIDDCHAPPASTPKTIEIPDSQFFSFDAGRSLEKFQIGQIWAFYSDEDGLPKYYGQINRIETSPDLELHVTWLTCSWLPENTIRWEDKDMLISCGRFKINKKGVHPSVYSNTYCVSHLVHADTDGKNKEYAIFPRKGEVWALYRKWSTKIKCSDLDNWDYDIVEVLGENDLWIDVLVLEFVGGFSAVFRGKSNGGSAVTLRLPRKELLRFSHQIPAFKLTEEHGNLIGFWELDPGALPIHYYGSK